RATQALGDAIRFGSLKGNPRCGAIVKAAIRACWGRRESATLLQLLIGSGDADGSVLAAAINANDDDAVKRLLAGF
ncbi:MAG TPA: hypothetical protein VMR52_12335, partial [Dehalococcoidia bacterium]|nr:hypothetical protein [Dehalococcoidia bacterium]